jgi:polyhydroxybutyrate depolymerase
MHRLFILSIGLIFFCPASLFVARGETPPADSDPTTTIVTDLNKLISPGQHRARITIDDYTRKFIFVTPTGLQPDRKVPVVFFLHGAGGTAEQALRTYGWTGKAEAEHFFLVVPQGLPARPDRAGSFILNPPIWRDERIGLPERGVNDIHFFERLLNDLQAVLPIDTDRIYVTGFSNGAAMTFTLGAHFSDRIAAIAPVSSQSFVRVESLARPLPVYYLTGTADPLVPYLGGTVTLPWGNTRTTPPVQESVDEWARLDGCPAQPQLVSDANGVRVQRYGPGRRQSEVLFTTIEGNGHHWPGTAEPLPGMISGPSLDPFNATDRIWAFFVEHPMEKK